MPLHPFLVHFPLAIWLLGSLLLCLAIGCGRENWQQVAWFLLYCGALCTIPAVLAGQSEYQRLAYLEDQALERHRDLGNLLPWLMGLLVALKLHCTYALRATWHIPAWFFGLASLILSALLLYTGFLGGVVVYGQVEYWP